ncbi:MAG: alpha/beta hydrolase [Anaerolineae bacterium]
MRAFRVYFLATLVLLGIPVLVNAQRDMTAILAGLGGYACLTVISHVTLTVPLNHFSADDTRRIDVVFGVLPATGERKGMFVTAVGGPGYFGLSYADSYTAAFDPAITEHFDIVFFDQRGEGLSGNFQCQNAATVYYSSDTGAETPEQEQALISNARTFANVCVEEAGFDISALPYYSTVQSIEDLDLFRKAIGDDKLWLYGESYGTQYVQTYTAAHPDHVAALITDGTVDLNTSALDYYVEQTQAFNDVLAQTLQACNQDAICAAQTAGDAQAFYDDLAAELSSSPQAFDFPLPGNRHDSRQFTLADLETVAAGQLYSEDGRMIFQRALAAAANGDLVPLARLAYYNLGLDPETTQPIPAGDVTYSDAMYYAIECNDYDFFSGTPEAKAEAFMRAGDNVEATVPYLSSVFYGDLPCVFWPGKPPTERPKSLVAEGIPTLVLGATADPATPVDNGKRVFSRLADGYLVTTQGGAHVIFGRGDACPDELVTAFLVEGTPPDKRETMCNGVVASDYVSLAPSDSQAFDSPLLALDSAYDEIYYLPEYYYWDYDTLTLTACSQGGTLAFAPSAQGTQFHLSACAFSAGFAMTGTGLLDADGNFSLDVRIDGQRAGQLSYSQDSEGFSSVSGEFDSNTIALSSDS